MLLVRDERFEKVISFAKVSRRSSASRLKSKVRIGESSHDMEVSFDDGWREIEDSVEVVLCDETPSSSSHGGNAFSGV